MKILIVDEDPTAAERLAGAVAGAGWGEAFAAVSAEDAAEIANREHGIDVLVTQVFLAGVDGFTLRESMAGQLPELRTVFLSEYDLSGHAERVGDWPVLPRPVDEATLLAALEGLFPELESEPAVITPDETAPPLPGAVLGTYRLDALLGEDLDGPIYQAVQTTIGRTVELHALAAERAADPATVERFLANARAKANVHHPALLSVFEAGESDGTYFYTSELRQGASLWELARQGAQLAPPVLLQLLHTVAEVMVHLGQEKSDHEPLHAVHVIVDPRSRARLVNIATSAPMGASARADMASLAAAIDPIMLAHPSAGALQQLLTDMTGAAMTVRSWTALIYEVKRCVGAVGQPSYGLDPGGRAEIEAVGATRRRQRRSRRLVIVAGLLLLLAGGAGAWFYLHGVTLPWAK